MIFLRRGEIQIIYCLAKLLSSFEILQRHCVGEPSQKFLLDLNLSETIFCLDFLTCPQTIFLAKILLFNIWLAVWVFWNIFCWLHVKILNYKILCNMQKKDTNCLLTFCQLYFCDISPPQGLLFLDAYQTDGERKTVKRRQRDCVFLFFWWYDILLLPAY